MTNEQWIKAVRKYAVEFGCYSFSQAERIRMEPYIFDSQLLQILHTHRYLTTMQCGIQLTFDFMADMERGMVIAITEKLTQ